MDVPGSQLRHCGTRNQSKEGEEENWDRGWNGLAVFSGTPSSTCGLKTHKMLPGGKGRTVHFCLVRGWHVQGGKGKEPGTVPISRKLRAGRKLEGSGRRKGRCVWDRGQGCEQLRAMPASSSDTVPGA